jgi:hypothetical protein
LPPDQSVVVEVIEMSKRNRIKAATAALLMFSAFAVSAPLTSHVHPIGKAAVVAVEPGGEGH